MIHMTFKTVAGKLNEELKNIIQSKKEVNDYELIVYKYLFITELKIPVHEDLGVEITDDSFILYIIPDDLEFDLLKDLSDAFSDFQVTFMPNQYNLLKLKFRLW